MNAYMRRYYSTCNACGDPHVVTTDPQPMCQMCYEQWCYDQHRKTT